MIYLLQDYIEVQKFEKELAKTQYSKVSKLMMSVCLLGLRTGNVLFMLSGFVTLKHIQHVSMFSLCWLKIELRVITCIFSEKC